MADLLTRTIQGSLSAATSGMVKAFVSQNMSAFDRCLRPDYMVSNQKIGKVDDKGLFNSRQ